MNECETDNGQCEQVCVNDLGSYHCECLDGWFLEPDGKTCLGKISFSRNMMALLNDQTNKGCSRGFYCDLGAYL